MNFLLTKRDWQKIEKRKCIKILDNRGEKGEEGKSKPKKKKKLWRKELRIIKSKESLTNNKVKLLKL